MILRKKSLVSLLLAVLVLVLAAAPALAAVPSVNGSYVAANSQGNFKFTPQRAVIQFGYEGKFNIAGKGYPGSMAYVRGTSNISFVWYYGTSGIQAGTALVSPVSGATYSGPITFTDRQGNVTDSGTLTVIIQ